MRSPRQQGPQAINALLGGLRGVVAAQQRQHGRRLLPICRLHRLLRDERQAQILRAAATAFARTGFASTSMDDVAAEAGITRLIVYRHFDSKEDLYRAVLTKVTEQLGERWEQGMAAEDRHGMVFRMLLSVARCFQAAA